MRRPAGVAADRGSATVWLLSVSLVLMMATVAMLCVGGAVVARHRAAAAADLAALAAAQRLATSGGAPCTVAARVAVAQGARLAWCRISQEDATVLAEVPLHGLLTGLAPARAQARAGVG